MYLNEIIKKRKLLKEVSISLHWNVHKFKKKLLRQSKIYHFKFVNFIHFYAHNASKKHIEKTFTPFTAACWL